RPRQCAGARPSDSRPGFVPIPLAAPTMQQAAPLHKQGLGVVRPPRNRLAGKGSRRRDSPKAADATVSLSRNAGAGMVSLAAMLLGLTIRDVVLIDRLSLAFRPGLCVLT